MRVNGRVLPSDIAPECVVAFPVGPGRNGHELADNGLGRVAAALYGWGDVFDGKASSHDVNLIQPGATARCVHRSVQCGGREALDRLT